MLAVPVFAGRVLGPGGKALDTAVGGTLEAFMAEAGFEGKAEETLAVPAGKLGAKGALLVGLGDKKTLSRSTGCAGRRPPWSRRSPKAKTVATTLLDAVPTGGRPGRRRPGAGRGRGARRLQVPALQAEVRRRPPSSSWCVLGKKDDAVQRGLDRGVGRGRGGGLGPRPGQRAGRAR